jgi:phytoene dehydrogenase-like protein
LQGFSAVTLYLGLKKSPEGLGFQGENHWIYRQYDHDSADLWSTKLAQGKCQMAYLSFPSLKDPQADQHKAEVISLADYRTFATWSDKPWKKRGEDYEALKTKIANGMLDLVEHRYPGFRENIDYWELSTPLSMEHFTNRNLGLMYGIPATPGRFQLDWLIPRTPIKNLFLSGSDVCSPGIVGAMMGGLFAASAILGSLGIFKIMYQIKKAAKTVPD